MNPVLKWMLIVLGASIVVAGISYGIVLCVNHYEGKRNAPNSPPTVFSRRTAPDLQAKWEDWELRQTHMLEPDTRCVMDARGQCLLMVSPPHIHQFKVYDGELVWAQQYSLSACTETSQVAVNDSGNRIAVTDGLCQRLWVFIANKGTPQEIDLEPDVRVHHIRYQGDILWVGASNNDSGMLVGYNSEHLLVQKLTGDRMFGLHFDLKPGVMLVASPQEQEAHQFVMKDDGKFHHQKTIRTNSQHANSMFPLSVAVDEYGNLAFLGDPTRSVPHRVEVGAVHQGSNMIVSTIGEDYQYFGDTIHVLQNHLLVGDRKNQSFYLRMDAYNRWVFHQTLAGKVLAWHDEQDQQVVWTQDAQQLCCYTCQRKLE